MSQIYNISEGSTPPSVATSYTTDNGTAVPAANVLLVYANYTSDNNDNGIVSQGGVVGTGTANEIDITLTNRFQATGSTVGAVSADLITFSLGASPATFFFNLSVVGFNASTPAGCAYDTFTTARTTGLAVTIIGDTDSIDHSDAALAGAMVDMISSGTDVILRVTGVAGLTVNWNVVGTYLMVTG